MATLPETSYILDAYKEFIIQTFDPSKICPTDLNRGLKFKEKMIAMYTHELLAEYIPNYKEMEDEAALDPENYNLIRFLKRKPLTTEI